jgi:hypothetical protein
MPRSGEEVEGLSRSAVYRGAAPSVPPERRIVLKKHGKLTLVAIQSLRRYIEALPDAKIRTGPRRIGVKRELKSTR